MPPVRSKKSGGEAKTNDGEKKPSFWATFPGILTAAGTFIAACAGLVTALNTAGVIGTQKEQDTKVSQADSAGTIGVQPKPTEQSAEPTKPTAVKPVPDQSAANQSMADYQSPMAATTVVPPQQPQGSKSAEKRSAVLTEGEVQHLDFADANLSAVFQNMNGEKYITLRVMPAGEESFARAAFEGSRVEFKSAGNRYLVQITKIDYADRKVTLTANCTSCY